MSKSVIKQVGLIAGPLLGLVVCILLPLEYQKAGGEIAHLSAAGRATLGVMVWMAVWWLSEPIHISATAFLPVILLPILGATSVRDAALPYSHPLVFLVMGGFLIAVTMQKWNLDRRLALMTLIRVGSKPAHMVAGIMAVTASLSAFVSNTATAAAMLPITLSVVNLYRRSVGEGDQKRVKNFALCSLLGLAYSASIGGIATIIGTGPNSFLVGFVDETYNYKISFARWLGIGLPLTAVFLPATWFLLTKILYPLDHNAIEGGHDLMQNELSQLGRVGRAEMMTLIVFALAAALWTFRPLLCDLRMTWLGQQVAPFSGLTDTGIAMLSVMLLFVLPVNLKDREYVLDWDTAAKIPWGILILFGGGLSLSESIQSTGVAEYLASQSRHLAGLPVVALVVLVTFMVTFLTELTSNVATTTTLVPILAALAPGLGVNPYLLIVPATLAASCAFMLPVATPPNAIVFGSGEIDVSDMVKAGIWLNLIAIALISTLTIVAVPLVFGADAMPK